MSRLVDDLFLLARADAGHHSLTPLEVYLDELVEESVRSLRTLAAARGIELRYAAGPEMPFRGDEALLRRLMVNLLGNAIKHGAAGRPVTVRAEHRGGPRGGAPSGEYVIAVHNEGPPIPLEQQQRVFDRFFRAGAARGTSGAHVRASAFRHGDETGAGGGAGLGLAIGRWIAEAHGGRLRLARSDATGTTFEITLPASREHVMLGTPDVL